MKLLTRVHVPILAAALLDDPYYNLFLIGDLDRWGTDHPDLFYWGQFDGEALVGVAMRYKKYWQFYDAGGADRDAMATLVDVYPDDSMVSGTSALAWGIVERLRQCVVTRARHCTYCALALGASLPAPAHTVRRAGMEDVEELAVHFGGADTMNRDAASIRAAIEQTRIFVTVAGGRIVSTALTNVETRSMAMVGGVYTPEPLRGRGYATAAMTGLCKSLLGDGLEPCLFYDNPAAGRIYRRLGFRSLGPWSMVSLERR